MMEQKFVQQPEPSFGQRLGMRLADILWHKPYDILELGVATPLLLFSLQLMNPWVDTFSSSPVSFRALSSLAPEIVWGVIGFLLAAFEIWSTLWQNRPARICASAGVAAYLCFFGVQLFLANPFGTGWVTYSTLGLFGFLIFIRTMKDIG